MPLIECVPYNSGGARIRNDPQVTVYPNGQIIFNHAASEKLGNPRKIRIKLYLPEGNEPGDPYIVVTPTLPEDIGGYSFSGGGNTQKRVKLSQYRTLLGPLVGHLVIDRRAGNGVILRKKTPEKVK